MMNHRESILSYFDSDEFMSRRPNATPNEEGNPLTETGIAYALIAKLGLTTKDDRERFKRAMSLVQVEPGLYHKKPRTHDELTKDDLFGVIAASVALDTYHRIEIAEYGLRNGWQFSNTGFPYLSSFTRPWDIPVYMLAGGMNPSIWSIALFCIAILVDAFVKKSNDPSSKRLMWLGIYAIKGKSKACDLCASIWKRRIDIRKKFEDFYGTYHPFTMAVGETKG